MGKPNDWWQQLKPGMPVNFTPIPGRATTKDVLLKGEKVYEIRSVYHERSYEDGVYGGGYVCLTNGHAVYAANVTPADPNYKYYEPITRGNTVKCLDAGRSKALEVGKEYLVTWADPNYGGKRGGILTIEGSETRFWRDRFEKVVPKTKFKVGDTVLPTKQTMGFYPRQFTKYNNFKVESFYNNSQPDSAGNFRVYVRNVQTDQLINSSYYESMFELCPADWEPPKYEVDLASLTLSMIPGLHEVGFGSCCGFRGIYGFSGLGVGLRDGNGNPIPGGPPVTAEMIQHAIQNFCKTRVTASGMSMAILATTQIPLYEPILLAAGFTKTREYANHNHGPTHMNAQYCWYADDYKAENKKRSFG